jgi:hypothetical protein
MSVDFSPRRRRESRVRFYVCCCPLTLALAPFVVAARLAHDGTMRLLGRPVAWPWAS